MLTALFFIMSQIALNKNVDREIDALEAKKYHLFTDIDGFESAQFLESNDSIIVHLKYVANDIVYDSAVIVDHEVLKALDSYIHNFRMIIEDEYFRRSFIETFKIDWPIVTKGDIRQTFEASRDVRLKTTSCCVAGGCALGAYGVALLTRKVSTEIDTVGLPVPCITGGDAGCVFIPLPFERRVYSYTAAAYLAGAGLGSGLTYIWAKGRYKRNDVLFAALGHNIVAFDYENYPITENDIAAANRGTNEALLGTLGLGAGFVSTGVTAIGLLAPWADKHPEQQWQAHAIEASVIVICGVEFVLITNFLMNKGRQLDRMATIEKLMHRHNE
jgi:hypothetical protein